MQDKDNKNDADNHVSTPLWTRDFIAITVVNFLLFCGFQFFPSSLPLYAKELGVTDDVIGWITGLTTLSALVIRPLAGRILDRLGRKGIFFLSLVIMIFISFSYSVFPFVAIIFLLRFFHGIGWGMATTSTSTIATDVIPRKRFAEGMGYFSLSASLALAIAPGISIELFHSAGMPIIAYAATGVLVCALILAMNIRFKPIPHTAKHRPEGINSLFEKRSYFPTVVMFFITASYGAIVTFVAVYADAQGVASIGLFFTVYAVVLLVSRPFLGRLVDRKGASWTVLPGILSIICALILLSFSSSLMPFLATAVLYGFGFGATQSGLQMLAVAKIEPERRGTANATFFTGFDGGIGFGAIISGLVVSLVGYSSMYLLFAIPPFIALVLYVLGIWRKKSELVFK